MRHVIVPSFFLCNRYSAQAYYTVRREVAQKLAHAHTCSHTIKNTFQDGRPGINVCSAVLGGLIIVVIGRR